MQTSLILVVVVAVASADDVVAFRYRYAARDHHRFGVSWVEELWFPKQKILCTLGMRMGKGEVYAWHGDAARNKYWYVNRKGTGVMTPTEEIAVAPDLANAIFEHAKKTEKFGPPDYVSFYSQDYDLHERIIVTSALREGFEKLERPPYWDPEFDPQTWWTKHWPVTREGVAKMEL